MTTRRYEVLLPARFNDGHEVVETCMRCLPDTLMEVVDRFGALTFNPQPANGVWSHGVDVTTTSSTGWRSTCRTPTTASTGSRRSRKSS